MTGQTAGSNKTSSWETGRFGILVNLYDEELMEGVMSFKKETDTKPTKYFRPGRCNA
jgi:hypothetical protein